MTPRLMAAAALAAGLLIPARAGPALTAAPPVMGATTNPSAYPGTSYATSAARLDRYTGHPMATTIGKRYVRPPYPARVTSQFTTAKSYLIVLYPGWRGGHVRPSRTPADVTAMTGFVRMLRRAGVHAVYALWNEPSNTGSSPFPSPASYKSWWDYYARPLAALHVTIVYDAAGWKPATAVAYYPGDRYVDEVVEDYYATAYWNRRAARLGPIAALADKHKPAPIPFGLGEWGVTAGTSAMVPKPAQFAAYGDYLTRFFRAREQAGKASCFLIWFNDPGHGEHINTVTASYRYTPTIDSVYRALAGK